MRITSGIGGFGIVRELLYILEKHEKEFEI